MKDHLVDFSDRVRYWEGPTLVFHGDTRDTCSGKDEDWTFVTVAFQSVFAKCSENLEHSDTGQRIKSHRSLRDLYNHARLFQTNKQTIQRTKPPAPSCSLRAREQTVVQASTFQHWENGDFNSLLSTPLTIPISKG